MTTQWEPLRKPSGMPSGGQFAAQAHSEPDDIDLDPRDIPRDELMGMNANQFTDWVVEHIRHGTYSFPPSPVHPIQVGAFWCSVQTPDEVLRRFESSWPGIRASHLDRCANEMMAAEGHARPDETVIFGRKKVRQEVDEWNQRWMELRQHAETMCAPQQLKPHEVRLAVQKIQAYRQIMGIEDVGIRNMYLDESTSSLISHDEDPIALKHVPYYYAFDSMDVDAMMRDPGSDMPSQLSDIQRSLASLSSQVGVIGDFQDFDFATRDARNSREFNRMARRAGFDPNA